MAIVIAGRWRACRYRQHGTGDGGGGASRQDVVDSFSIAGPQRCTVGAGQPSVEVVMIDARRARRPRSNAQRRRITVRSEGPRVSYRLAR